MPKPKSKSELLETGKINYEKLMELVSSYSSEEIGKEFPERTLNRNIRDVLAHVYHWHIMLLGWYEVGMKGEKPDMPAEGYTWQTMPDLNKVIRQKYQNEELKSVRVKLDKTYSDIRVLIAKHSDDELFEKKRYKWTGSTSVGVYLISNTTSHYNWAYKLIKKSMK